MFAPIFCFTSLAYLCVSQVLGVNTQSTTPDAGDQDHEVPSASSSVESIASISDSGSTTEIAATEVGCSVSYSEVKEEGVPREPTLCHAIARAAASAAGIDERRVMVGADQILSKKSKIKIDFSYYHAPSFSRSHLDEDSGALVLYQRLVQWTIPDCRLVLKSTQVSLPQPPADAAPLPSLHNLRLNHALACKVANQIEDEYSVLDVQHIKSVPQHSTELVLMLASKVVREKHARNTTLTPEYNRDLILMLANKAIAQKKFQTPGHRMIKPRLATGFLRNLVLQQGQSNVKIASQISPVASAMKPSTPVVSPNATPSTPTPSSRRPRAQKGLSGGVRLGVPLAVSPSDTENKENIKGTDTSTSSPAPAPTPGNGKRPTRRGKRKPKKAVIVEASTA